MKNRAVTSFVKISMAVFLVLGFSSESQAEDGTATAPPSDQNPVFKSSLTDISPMTPKEVIEFRRYAILKHKALFDSRPPQFHQVQDVLKLHPGAFSPVIRISPGYSGAIYFTDMTGAAWPVSEAKISVDAFVLEHPKTKAFNSLIVSSGKVYRSGDVIVFLKGLDFPVALRVISDPKNTDMKTNIVVPRIGPHPNLPDVAGTQSLSAGIVSDVEERFIAGIPPKGAVKVGSSRNGVSVWLYNGEYYVRTLYALASPAYVSLTKGDGGINIYKLVPTPVLILSINGKEEMVSLNDESEVSGER